jgi:hypothetical protein
MPRGHAVLYKYVLSLSIDACTSFQEQGCVETLRGLDLYAVGQQDTMELLSRPADNSSTGRK